MPPQAMSAEGLLQNDGERSLRDVESGIEDGTLLKEGEGSDDSMSYEVERIVAHESYGILYRSGKVAKHSCKESDLFYKVKWKGYSMEESTWEPLENLQHLSILKKYRRKYVLFSRSKRKAIQKDRRCERLARIQSDEERSSTFALGSSFRNETCNGVKRRSNDDADFEVLKRTKHFRENSFKISTHSFLYQKPSFGSSRSKILVKEMAKVGLRRYSSAPCLHSACVEWVNRNQFSRDDLAVGLNKEFSAQYIIAAYLRNVSERGKIMWSSWKSIETPLASFFWKLYQMYGQRDASTGRAKYFLFNKIELMYIEKLKGYLNAGLADPFVDGLQKILLFRKTRNFGIDEIIEEICELSKGANQSPLGTLLTRSACVKHEKCSIVRAILFYASQPLRVRICNHLGDFGEGNILQKILVASNYDGVCVIKTLIEYGVDPNGGGIPIVLLAARQGKQNLVKRLIQCGCNTEYLSHCVNYG